MKIPVPSEARHNYHDTHKVFPPGFMNFGDNISNTPAWGWGALILPFVEQKPLHDSMGVSVNQMAEVVDGSAAPRALVTTELDGFICPSSKSRGTNPDRKFNYSGTGNLAIGTSDYLACSGVRKNGRNWAQDKLGVFWSNSARGFFDITDGTSNVFAVGERDKRCRSGTWAGCYNTDGEGNVGFHMVIANCYYKLNNQCNNDNRRSAFSSQHPDGANFLLCDGSARFVSDLIEFNVGGRDNNDGLNQWKTTASNGNAGVYQLLAMREDGFPLRSW